MDKHDATNILKQIFQRYYIWNFRDMAKFNPFISEGKIFRSATLSIYGKDAFILQQLKYKNISTIIDLRADREIAQLPYNKDFIKNFKYVNIPFDPWTQPQWFINSEHYGTNIEIAYRFFVKACKSEIKKVFETIANSTGSVLIHCHGGKDRTGLIATLIHLLTGADYTIALNDYLASNADTTEDKFKIYYNEILKHGGIQNYLLSCGLSPQIIKKIKTKLKK